MSNAVDVLIIGAGQAALALGQALAGGPWQYQLLQRHARVGDSWRRRYDSLVLFTPRSYSALPGMPVPGAPEGYASKDEIADYLEAYAARFALPIATSTGVRSLVRTATGYRAITDTGRSIDARAVVIATGGFQGRHWHTLRDAFGTHAALFGVNPWRLQAWLGYKRIDETMLYVHVAEAHHRKLPEIVRAKSREVGDPDQRVLAMLVAR